MVQWVRLLPVIRLIVFCPDMTFTVDWALIDNMQAILYFCCDASPFRIVTFTVGWLLLKHLVCTMLSVESDITNDCAGGHPDLIRP